MNKLLLLLLLCTPLFAFECAEFSDLLPLVDSETWVVCDIDNTLIESEIQLGSPQWRNYIHTKVLNAGYDKEEAEEVVDWFWYFVQPFIPVRAVDPCASEILDTLSQNAAGVIALTERDPAEADFTEKHLEEGGITLTPDAIIYCGKERKGERLASYFRELGHLPKKIVFIDDRLDHVCDVESAMERLGVTCNGLRFSGADSRVECFNPMIADLQWIFLPMIVSDSQATLILSRG